MRAPRKLPVHPGQALLFAPAALLALGVLVVARNVCSRPVVLAQDFPDRGREALIFLEYPPAYPFSGGVQAVLEVRRLPDHRPAFSRTLGRYRWAREAIAAYKVIDWAEEGKVVLRRIDGEATCSFRVPGEDRAEGGPGTEG